MLDTTLFPAYDGSTPGEVSETNVDITGQPLEPLFAESSVLSEPGASQVSDIPGRAPAADELELGAIDQGQRPGREDQPRPDRLQSRIDKLTRARYEKERENNVLNETIAALSQGLQTANARIAQLSTPRPTSSNPGLSSDPFASAERQPSAPPATLDEARIGEMLDRRLQPVLQLFQDQAQGSNLRLAHEASFSEAVKDYPELARQDSEFRSEFNNLFDKSPLKTLPDAPYQVALQVRGLLADSRRERQATNVRKQSAGVQVPSNSSLPDFGPQKEVNGVPAGEWKTREANLQKIKLGTATQAERMQVMRVNQFLHNRKA